MQQLTNDIRGAACFAQKVLGLRSGSLSRAFSIILELPLVKSH